MNSTAGFLWQGRFRMQIIQKERYLSVCARYIEMNPVKACMVLQAQDYLFSSARFYCFGNEDGVTTESPIFMGFGNDIDVRRTAYKDFLGKLYNSRDEYRYEFSSTPFGDREFINTMVKVGGRLLPKRRGRPRERKDCFITH
jgi:putative transposase